MVLQILNRALHLISSYKAEAHITAANIDQLLYKDF